MAQSTPAYITHAKCVSQMILASLCVFLSLNVCVNDSKTMKYNVAELAY